MSSLWGLLLTVVIFSLAKKFSNVRFIKKLPAMVITGVILIIILRVFKLDYVEYNKSACFLTLLLGPATIALALPLVKNIELLTQNKRAIYLGFVVATLTAIAVTFIVGNVFHTDWNIVISLLPKSVTTPIAVEISKAIGGIPELTACIVSLTGIYGAVLGHKILKLCKIKSDIAIGLAIGAASHVLGTSSCVEKNKQKQVVMATLALIIIGILTTIICVIIF